MIGVNLIVRWWSLLSLQISWWISSGHCWLTASLQRDSTDSPELWEVTTISNDKISCQASLSSQVDNNLLLLYIWLVIPVFVCGVAGLDRTIIIIRDNRLLSLQVIKSSRCKSQEKNINLSSVGCQERGERGPILGLTSFCWGRLSLPR